MSTDPATYQPKDYDFAAISALPPGDAWSKDPASLMAGIQGVSADIVALVMGFAVEFLDVESNPATAVLLLSEWEDRYGLPDPCTPLAPTIAQRQAAVAARIIATGGQSVPYFTAIAAVFGATVSIAQVMPSTPGIGAYLGNIGAGDPLYGPAAVGEWQVTVAHGFAGNQAQFECTMRRFGPAQGWISFTYL